MSAQGRSFVASSGIDEDRILVTLPKLYDTLAQPELWPNLLSEMNKIVGADGAFVVNHASGQYRPSSDRVQALLAEYTEEEWAKRNPWPQRIVAKGLINAVATEWNLFSPEELKRQPIYSDLFLKHGFSSSMTVVLTNESTMVSLSFLRTEWQGQFSESELASFARVLPALHQFGRLAARLASARDAGTADLLDQMSDGAILIGSSGRPLHLNSAAKHYLGEAITFECGVVLPLHPAAADQFKRRLAQLVGRSHRPITDLATTGCVLLPGKSARRPVFAEIVPLRRAAGDLFRNAAAVVILTDPDKQIAVDEELCRHLFGLSPAEARLASAVCRGEDFAGFAKASGLAVDTVRKRAKSLFAKTGTRRQAELAALLGRLRRDLVARQDIVG